eukprot:6193213-Pleurochrysis_carterae.AAC.3
MASAARAPTEDDSDLTAVSFATAPGGRSYLSDLAAVACVAWPGRSGAVLCGAGVRRALAPCCATCSSLRAASSHVAGGASVRRRSSTWASSANFRQSVAATCCARRDPAETDGVSSASLPAAFASAPPTVPSPPSCASSSRMPRAASACSSTAGRRPANASGPASPRRVRLGAGSPSGGPSAGLRPLSARSLGRSMSLYVSVCDVPGVDAAALSASLSASRRLMRAERGETVAPAPEAGPEGDERCERRRGERCGDAAAGSSLARIRSTRAASVPLVPALVATPSSDRSARAPRSTAPAVPRASSVERSAATHACPAAVRRAARCLGC